MSTLIQKITNYLITHILKEEVAEGPIVKPEKRKKVAYLEAWISISSNLVLAVIKFIFGLMINSISLIADAVHTASDVLTSAVVILGFKLSALPADDKHRYGHGRIEFISTLIISLMLLAVGIKFGFDSYYRYLENTAVKGSFLVIIIMIAAGGLKELLSRISIDMGNKINSATLIADAWHHRTDAIASLLVAFAILASSYGYYRVDAILGFGVSLLIIWTGLDIFRESCSKLIGETDTRQIQRINEIAMGIPGVFSTHDIAVHDYGGLKVVSIHVEVDGNLSLIQAHEIGEQVELAINHELYASTTVHLDSVESS
jgi:cation diffusion facilitator family transporter